MIHSQWTRAAVGAALGVCASVGTVCLTLGVGRQQTWADDWPGFRGPARTGLSTETGLLKEWPKDGPPLAWTASGFGAGYGSVSVVDGKLFTTGYLGEEEMLIAAKIEDGSILWTTPIGPAAGTRKRRKGNTPKEEKPASEAPSIGYPGSRSTPTVDTAAGTVYVISSLGDLLCAKLLDGSPVWRKSFRSDFGGRLPGWGFAESPLLDGDKLVCSPCGKGAAMVALHKADGSVLWTCDANPGDAAGYASMVVADIAGVRQYVQLMGKGTGLVGVDAATGKLLWNYDKIANGTANIPTPIVKGDYVLGSTGYNDGGTALLKIAKTPNGQFAVEEVWYKDSKTLQNHHGGMLLIGDHVYFGNKHNNGFPVCVEFLTGKIVWGGDTRGPGSGSAAITSAEGMLYFRYQNHVVALFEATPDGLKQHGQFTIPNGERESWAHPVVAEGRLFLRNQDRMLCYKLSAR